MKTVNKGVVVSFCLALGLFAGNAMANGHGGGHSNNDHGGGHSNNDHGGGHSNNDHGGGHSNNNHHSGNDKTPADWINEGYKAGLNGKDRKDLKGDDHQKWFDKGFNNGRNDLADRRNSYDRDYPYYYNGGYYSRPYSYDYGYDNRPDYGYSPSTGSSSGSAVSCSPSALTDNTYASQGVLVGLSENEFAGNEAFVSKVNSLDDMSGETRINEGLRLIGVQNPGDSKEVLEAIYAREPSKAAIARVSKEFGMSNDQAKLVILTVTRALKAQ